MNAPISGRARHFLAESEASPVVYGSVDGNHVTYRLANGKKFRLGAEDARQAANPRWAFHVLKRHRNEELELLAKVEAESRQPDAGERR